MKQQVETDHSALESSKVKLKVELEGIERQKQSLENERVALIESRNNFQMQRSKLQVAFWPNVPYEWQN